MSAVKTSLLLQCPLEIRQRVYSFVLAPGMIHIEWEPEIDSTIPSWQADRYKDNPLRHRICATSESETAFHQRWLLKQNGGNLDYEEPFAERHACKGGAWHISPDQRRHKLDLRLLRVCRQIYTEAFLTAYEENTFAFEEFETFCRFTRAMRRGQIQVIKGLQFGLTLRKYMQGSWLAGIKSKQARLFESLRTLHICLHLDIWDAQGNALLKDAGIVALLLASGLYNFGSHAEGVRRNDLRVATVIVTEAPDDTYLDDDPERIGRLAPSVIVEEYEDAFHWTSDERRSQTQAARSHLLSKNGNRNFSERELEGCKTLTAVMIKDRERAKSIAAEDADSDDDGDE